MGFPAGGFNIIIPVFSCDQSFVCSVKIPKQSSISVDQYFYPSQNSGSECRKRIDAMLNALDERELKIVEATIQAMKASKETEET